MSNKPLTAVADGGPDIVGIIKVGQQLCNLIQPKTPKGFAAPPAVASADTIRQLSLSHPNIDITKLLTAAKTLCKWINQVPVGAEAPTDAKGKPVKPAQLYELGLLDAIKVASAAKSICKIVSAAEAANSVGLLDDNAAVKFLAKNAHIDIAKLIETAQKICKYVNKVPFGASAPKAKNSAPAKAAASAAIATAAPIKTAAPVKIGGGKASAKKVVAKKPASKYPVKRGY